MYYIFSNTDYFKTGKLITYIFNVIFSRPLSKSFFMFLVISFVKLSKNVKLIVNCVNVFLKISQTKHLLLIKKVVAQFAFLFFKKAANQ